MSRRREFPNPKEQKQIGGSLMAHGKFHFRFGQETERTYKEQHGAGFWPYWRLWTAKRRNQSK